MFHTDGGGEFSSLKLSNHFSAQGILHQFNCPHTPRQCGIVERRHRSIVELGLTQLSQSGVSFKY